MFGVESLEKSSSSVVYDCGGLGFFVGRAIKVSELLKNSRVYLVHTYTRVPDSRGLLQPSAHPLCHITFNPAPLLNKAAAHRRRRHLPTLTALLPNHHSPASRGLQPNLSRFNRSIFRFLRWRLLEVWEKTSSWFSLLNPRTC